jgi:pyruvate ferredoxin oxidoreductase delta subunit
MKKDILKGKKGKWQELPKGGIVDEPGASKNFKTGDWRGVQKPKWIPEKCIQCLLCWVSCPDNAIKINNGEREETDFDYCKGCGICAKVCPTKAIEMTKKEK